MQTAIGVFPSREQAEEAVKLLLQHEVPRDRITYLTRSENDARSVVRHLESPSVDGKASNLALPGVGSVYASGVGAANLIEMPGLETRRSGTTQSARIWAPDSGEDSKTDLEFFCKILNEGYSVVVVRTESARHSAAASEVLNKLGLSMKNSATTVGRVTFRHIQGAGIAEMSGKIAFSEGTSLLREAVHNLVSRGYLEVFLNLSGVDYIDSAGIGELVRSQGAIQGRGGRLTLVSPSAGVRRLLQLTKLDRVFAVAPDELSALRAANAGKKAAS